MAGFLSRLFKVAQSQAHSTVDKLEDPIKMTEQGVRDLKTSLREAMESLAQVKAIAIRLSKDADDEKRKAADYERKAMTLLQKMQDGQLEQAEAERLAAEALSLKEEASRRAATLSEQYTQQDQMAGKLQSQVEKLKREIGRYENELVTLRARAKTAGSMKKINRHLAGTDSSSTVAMLERMRNKVEEDESLAQAYAEVESGTADVDTQIDRALEEDTGAKAQDSLAALKQKMGIGS